MMATKKAFKPCEGCPSPAKCKAAGKCMAKEGKGGKPVVAIMVGMAKPKGKAMMNKGGMAKKGKC
jgi:succinyl-CoA synthetase alpha subunit